MCYSVTIVVAGDSGDGGPRCYDYIVTVVHGCYGVVGAPFVTVMQLLLLLLI